MLWVDSLLFPAGNQQYIYINQWNQWNNLHSIETYLFLFYCSFAVWQLFFFFQVFKDMFINIRPNCAFKKTQKALFVNNFCVPKLQTLKFLTQKEPICIEGTKGSISISKFSLREELSFKNNSVYFLAMCANFPCKTEKFE